ncbi:MAG: Dabb family protein [Planctomycetes bacterium]|nr:Dabb family protein [Planctomycetota bacterium]
MAVQHMVWAKFNDGVGPERIAEHIAKVKTLADEIDFVQKVEVGENFTDRSKGFNVGLIVTLPDRESLPTYLEHPYHVEVATPLKADAELMALDIEV